MKITGNFLMKNSTSCDNSVYVQIKPCTCIKTRVEVAGAILNSKAIAVFASILRDWVVTLSPGQLDTSTTRSGTIPKWTPLPPSTIHLGQKQTKTR